MDLLEQAPVSKIEPKGPDDEELKDLIDTLASKVAKYGITYEELVKKMVQDMKDTHGREPQDISFIEEGNPFNEYYRHEVYNVYIFLAVKGSSSRSSNVWCLWVITKVEINLSPFRCQLLKFIYC